jgi:hypothetical protein
MHENGRNGLEEGSGDMNASRWSHYMDLLRENEDLIEATLDPSSPQLEAETHRLLLQTIVRTYPTIFHGDPDHPDWMPQLNNLYPHAAANPDTSYTFATIDGVGTYRLCGTRGSVRYVDIQSGVNMAGLHKTPGPGLETLDLDDLTIAEDGSFSFLWSDRRPEGYDGDWRPLDPRANYIMIRQVSYDWVNEQEARIAIERLDARPAKPRMTADEIDSKIIHVTESLRRSTRMFPMMLADKQKRGVVNRLELNEYLSMGGVTGQKYYEGLFDLSDEECLIIEAVIPPECGYWSVHLFDELFVTVDYMHRQSSLNGHTAYVSGSGGTQIVVASKDPGVQNWLDISDYPRGGITWRWLRAPDAPAPTVKKVPLSTLTSHLAAGTPPFDAAARTAQMSARRIGAQLRRRW